MSGRQTPEPPGAGWTAEEYAKCPEVIDRLHARILDLQDALERSAATPPRIVAEASDPAAALEAFIARDLEHCGFNVVQMNGGSLYVNGIRVKVTEPPGTAPRTVAEVNQRIA